MYDYIINLFSESNSKKRLVDAIARDAIIVDVRTEEEFARGHNKHAINIPINKFFDKLLSLKSMQRPIVVCCSSGLRSARAVTILKAAKVEVYNAGSWKNLAKL